MPGELNDPEQSIPYHYDPKYDNTPTPNGMEVPDSCKYLQSIVGEVLGIRLSPEKLCLLIDELEEKGFLHRNPGDETFRSEVVKQTKRLMMARKVARRCLT
jgi:hypothetical protein